MPYSNMYLLNVREEQVSYSSASNGNFTSLSKQQQYIRSIILELH
jgi:hypothetical protein